MLADENAEFEHQNIERIKKSISVHAKHSVKEAYIFSPLKSRHQRELELKHAGFQGFNQYWHRLNHGHTLLLEHGIFDLHHEEKAGLAKLFSQDSFNLAPGDSLQDKLQISDQTITACYKFGSQLYQRKDFQSAADTFLFLIALSPGIRSFWIALARAEENLGQDESALLSYMMALELDHDDLMPVFDCLNCLRRMQRTQEGAEMLEKALKIASDAPVNENFRKQALAYQAQLKGGL
jgi:tetratricopeptide (TPR) repeat protein